MQSQIEPNIRKLGKIQNSILGGGDLCWWPFWMIASTKDHKNCYQNSSQNKTQTHFKNLNSNSKLKLNPNSKFSILNGRAIVAFFVIFGNGYHPKWLTT